TVIGDAANVAARLQTAAEPGTILISEETYHLVQGYAQVERRGHLSLKGKGAPVQAYRLLDLSHPPATRVAPAARPFVDRTGRWRCSRISCRRSARGAAGWSASSARPGSASRGSSASSAGASPTRSSGLTDAASLIGRWCRISWCSICYVTS